MNDYFVTGYTGFCPDIAEHIGHNYHKATREIMKAHPHVKTRLSTVCCPPNIQRYERDCNYLYSASPEYEPTYRKDLVNSNVWRPCQGDAQSCDNTYPEPAYSLECSEWESPCVAKHCNEIYAPCLTTKSYYCQDHFQIPQEGAFAHQVQQRNSQVSEPCCDSCAKGGRCSGGDSNSELKYPRKKSKPCCNSCAQGGRCIGDSNSESKYPRKKSEPCCNSCARGGLCIGDSKKGTSMYKYPGRRIISSQKIMGYRKGGVIPNYMGHIPGMQNSYGESYGIASCRLLRRHFDELSRKGL